MDGVVIRVALLCLVGNWDPLVCGRVAGDYAQTNLMKCESLFTVSSPASCPSCASENDDDQSHQVDW